MGELDMGLFILCFAVVTTCPCLDVKMPKMIESVLSSLPGPRVVPQGGVCLSRARDRQGSALGSPKGLARRERGRVFLRFSLTSRSSLLSCVRSPGEKLLLN